jgi:hypothetical protein
MKRILSVALLLAACAGPAVTNLGTEQGNSTYRVVTLKMNSGRGSTLNTPHDVKIYLRFFDHDGKLAVCGFYVTPPTMSGDSRELMSTWFSGATIYAGDDPIAPARFLYERTPKFNEYDAQANCIGTASEFHKFDNVHTLRFEGANVYGNKG